VVTTSPINEGSDPIENDCHSSLIDAVQSSKTTTRQPRSEGRLEFVVRDDGAGSIPRAPN
jgi:hypothetical protein